MQKMSVANERMLTWMCGKKNKKIQMGAYERI